MANVPPSPAFLEAAKLAEKLAAEGQSRAPGTLETHTIEKRGDGTRIVTMQFRPD